MRHIDEIQIAGTAILLCGAMFAVSAVAPTGNTVSKAVTNFTEAPETAAEAQAQAEAQAEEDGFTIYTQEVTMILIMATVIMILLTMTLLTILIRRRTVLWNDTGPGE